MHLASPRRLPSPVLQWLMRRASTHAVATTTTVNRQEAHIITQAKATLAAAATIAATSTTESTTASTTACMRC